MNLTLSILKRMPMLANYAVNLTKWMHIGHCSTINSKCNTSVLLSASPLSLIENLLQAVEAQLKFTFCQNKLQIELCKLPLQVCPVGCSRTNSVSVTLNSMWGAWMVRNISRVGKRGFTVSAAPNLFSLLTFLGVEFLKQCSKVHFSRQPWREDLG